MKIFFEEPGVSGQQKRSGVGLWLRPPELWLRPLFLLYNHGWANLIPQKLKYTPALAAKAAKLLESGESLTATARAVKVSRASLRNWRERDPKLNEAFGTFEANKAKAEAKLTGVL